MKHYEFDLLDKGQIVTLEEDETMDIKSGLYKVLRVRYENDEVVYYMKNVHNVSERHILTMAYVHRIGYWGKL
jgi:hypothetical protein